MVRIGTEDERLTTVAINNGQPLKMKSDTNISLSSLRWSKLMASNFPIKCRGAGPLPARPGTGPPPALLCIPGNHVPQVSLPLAFMLVQPVDWWGVGRDAGVFSLLPSALWRSWQDQVPSMGLGAPGRPRLCGLSSHLLAGCSSGLWILDPIRHPSGPRRDKPPGLPDHPRFGSSALLLPA